MFLWCDLCIAECSQTFWSQVIPLVPLTLGEDAKELLLAWALSSSLTMSTYQSILVPSFCKDKSL